MREGEASDAAAPAASYACPAAGVGVELGPRRERAGGIDGDGSLESEKSEAIGGQTGDGEVEDDDGSEKGQQQELRHGTPSPLFHNGFAYDAAITAARREGL